jgi:hypothetical protein
MKIKDLPVVSAKPALEFPHFPTRYQAFIWRNWEMVSVSKLAQILSTSETQILKSAEGMGLPVPPEVNPEWLKKGYLTIIRNNWHILNYQQLLKLLGWNAEKLAYTLKEEDFLWVKLGKIKPKCKLLRFRELNQIEKQKAEQLLLSLHNNFSKPLAGYQEKPFRFFNKPFSPNKFQQQKHFKFNILHPFCASYGDVFIDSETEIISDDLLSQYASLGIDGIWLQAILYTLHPIKGAEEFSAGYEARLKNIKKLVNKCAKFNIGLYLYLNEPRCMPNDFYKKFPHWAGATEKSDISKCVCTTQTKEPLKWLGDACYNLYKKVPGLAGAILINMSENPTHCHSRFLGKNCPYCKNRPVSDILAEIIETIEKSIHSASPQAKVIAWDWAWRNSPDRLNDLEMERELIQKLPKNIIFMRESERAKKTTSGGIVNEVYDYSISKVGPSKSSMELWNFARERGLRTAAKIQLNNTWELSSVPYLPVPYLITEHLKNLHQNKIDGLMLSWSLGGYPGGNLELITKSPEQIANEKFGKEAALTICSAWKRFGEAFREFPFDIKVIYDAPMNFGPMNLLHLKATGYNSTMIGFPYDDLEGWRACYPEDVFEQQFQILSDGWNNGLKILEEAEEKIPIEMMNNYAELHGIATAAYCHFKSTHLQIKFTRLRNLNDNINILQMIKVLDEEILLAKKLHQVASKDSRIGFEASNHYYYSLNDLREKVISCEYLKKQLISEHII